LASEFEENISLSEDLGIDDSIILKWTLKKWVGRAWFVWFRGLKSDGLRTATFWLFCSNCDQEALPCLLAETEFEIIPACGVTCL
jgi:hypothetical protein